MLMKMKIYITHCQESNTLHTDTSLFFIIYWYLLKTTETKQLALFEITVERHSIITTQWREVVNSEVSDVVKFTVFGTNEGALFIDVS